MARNPAFAYDMIFTQPVVYEFDRLAMPTLLIFGLPDGAALGRDQVGPQK